MQSRVQLPLGHSPLSRALVALGAGLLVTIGAVSSVRAQTPILLEDAKVVSSDPAPEDRLGASVAMEGNLVVAGAGAQVGGVFPVGQAYVFRVAGPTWTEEAILTPSDAANGFGFSVALSGDVIAVGAIAAVNPGSGSGAVYVFRFDGTSWLQEAKLTAAGGFFGIGLDIQDDVIAVGAYIETTAAGSQAGAVYIFRHDGTSWNQEARLTASDGQATDQLGRRVSLSGDVVVASAWQADPSGSNSGATYVFRREPSSGVWSEEAKLTAPGGAAGDQFSSDVGVDGDVIVVGARFDSHDGLSLAGSAHVFRFGGSTWNHEALLTAANAAINDSFGHLVSICRNVATITSPFDGGLNTGAALVYVFDGASWTETIKLVASDGASQDLMGTGVAACENAIIAAVQHDSEGANAGALYFYTFSDADADGLIDYHEPFFGTDSLNADTDVDGLSDGDEVDTYGTSPTAADTDVDGLDDGDEVVLGTSPLASDTDSDGLSDGAEVTSGANPFVVDTDGDGLADGPEVNTYGTSPLLQDTDADALSDAEEIALQQFGCPNPLVADSDGEGLPDGLEYTLGLNLCEGDTDSDGLADELEVNTHGTNPLVQDTDGDGLFDGTEVDMAQGGGCPSPTIADSDGDTLSDGAEAALGTSPCNTDTDADTVADNIDDEPTNPGVSSDFIEAAIRDLCDFIGSLPLDRFAAPNNNARQGRRNAICNKLNAAANAVAAGDLEEASDQLESLLEKVDGEGQPPDWMASGAAETSVVHDELDIMIFLISLEP